MSEEYAPDYLVRDVAKLLGVKERELRTLLVDSELLHITQTKCGKDQYTLNPRMLSFGREYQTTIQHSSGQECEHTTTRITDTGVKRVRGLVEWSTLNGPKFNS